MTTCTGTTTSPLDDLLPPLARGTAVTRCPYCGRPDTQPFQVLSRHATADGQTVWTRCECGSLQWRVRDAAGERIVTRSPGRSPHPADR
ncbi:MAG TPA: hypothetical protein VF060_06305 [Trebonia sp.]